MKQFLTQNKMNHSFYKNIEQYNCFQHWKW